MSTAQAMLDNGMQALGWTYVNLDDCWAYARDNATGALTWDPERFPNGIPALADWLHARGFKFGLYTSIGDETCSSGGRPMPIPGSEGHFEQDAQSFADWGVDYVKLDWCGDVKDKFVVDGHKYGAQWHKDFAHALNATGRPMFLEVVAGYWFLKHETAAYANSWRFCEDHHDAYESTAEAVACRVDQGARPFNLTRGAGGAWPYMDFLMTGGQGCAPFEEGGAGGLGVHCPGQTDAAYATEFSLWALAQSPLVVATDVRNLTAVMRRALLNSELLALHQDVGTPPGRLVASGYLSPGHRLTSGASRPGANRPAREADGLCDFCQVWARAVALPGQPLGQIAVALTNWRAAVDGPGAQAVTATWSALGLPPGATVKVRDLWQHEDLPEVTGALTALVGPGETQVFLLTPV